MRELDRLAAQVEDDGGAVVGRYSDPFGGTPLLLAALPVDRVEPTPYQRDASDAHVKRLMNVIEKIGRFLDPIVAVREDGRYLTPNGNHRLQALKKLGVKTVIALLVPDAEVAFKILALNTEKAHNLREKSLETIRMARALAKKRRAEDELRVRVRAARVPDARHRLRRAAASERRRVPVDSAARRRISRRADGEGDQGARAPRPEDPEARRCGGRRGREAEGAAV